MTGAVLVRLFRISRSRPHPQAPASEIQERTIGRVCQSSRRKESKSLAKFESARICLALRASRRIELSQEDAKSSYREGTEREQRGNRRKRTPNEPRKGLFVRPIKGGHKEGFFDALKVA